MTPFLEEKLWDLLITTVSILISGGLLLTLIEWQRLKRERSQWKREEARLEIDVPRAEIDYQVWTIVEVMTNETKLMIYENGLLGKVRNYYILVDFVIRNTTNGELVVTSYGVEETAPPGSKVYHLYDLETASFINPENLSATVLKPLGTIACLATIIITRADN